MAGGFDREVDTSTEKSITYQFFDQGRESEEIFFNRQMERIAVLQVDWD